MRRQFREIAPCLRHRLSFTPWITFGIRWSSLGTWLEPCQGSRANVQGLGDHFKHRWVSSKMDHGFSRNVSGTQPALERLLSESRECYLSFARSHKGAERSHNGARQGRNRIAADRDRISWISLIPSQIPTAICQGRRINLRQLAMRWSNPTSSLRSGTKANGATHSVKSRSIYVCASMSPTTCSSPSRVWICTGRKTRRIWVYLRRIHNRIWASGGNSHRSATCLGDACVDRFCVMVFLCSFGRFLG